MPTKPCKTCGKSFDIDKHKPKQKNCTECGNHVISRKRNKIPTKRKPTANAASLKLSLGIVNCVCPICSRKHKARNCDPRHFCHNCRGIAERDYSDGNGTIGSLKQFVGGRHA